MEFEVVYMPKCKTDGCENDQSFMFLYCNECTMNMYPEMRPVKCDTDHKDKK